MIWLGVVLFYVVGVFLAYVFLVRVCKDDPKESVSLALWSWFLLLCLSIIGIIVTIKIFAEDGCDWLYDNVFGPFAKWLVKDK